MPGARNVVLVLTAAAVFTGFFLNKRANLPVRNLTGDATGQTATPPNAAVAPDIPEGPAVTPPMTANEYAPDQAASPRGNSADCITPAQLASDPMVAEEYARLDSVGTSGTTIASYRGLSSAQLSGLANQGDSAAMAVLGAMSVMRARNLPENRAVAYLLREDPGLWTFDVEQTMQPEARAHLEEARNWFYESALNGRLLALQNAGEVISMAGDTPSRLGWIDENEYESLEGYEKYALDPLVIYHVLAFKIAPTLATGPFEAVAAELTAGGERQQLILDELVHQFDEALEAAKLPPIEIPASTAPSTPEFESMLCESYLESVP